MKLRDIIVENAYGYKGKSFDLNKNATKLIKLLSEEITGNGLTEAENKAIFEAYFGKEINPLVDLCYRNKKCLNEMIEVNRPLLFEEDLQEGFGTVLSLSKGFLKQAWNIVKTFGLNVWDKLAGITWLKDLVLEATTSPTFNVVCSGLTVFFALGTFVNIIKIINKIRKKNGEKALTRKEKEEYKRILIERKKDLEKEVRKKGVKDFSIEAPEGINTKDEDIKFTSRA